MWLITLATKVSYHSIKAVLEGRSFKPKFLVRQNYFYQLQGEHRMAWRGSTTVKDRIFASLPYLLPIISVLPFGTFLFNQFPVLQVILIPLAPVLFIYRSIPFAGLVVFFLLFLLVVRNERIIHFIRFNTMQAILIDILLVLCSLAQQILLGPLGANLVTETLLNIVFLGTLAACGYSIVQSLRGLYAEIPTLSEAVHAQVP
jgi:hypothetical protein